MSRKTKDTVTLDEVQNKSKKKRNPELSRDQKDLMYGNKAYKRTVRDTIAERDSGYARLHDFYNHKNVQIFWDYNDEMVDKQLFKLVVGKEVVVLSAIELQKYLRWV